MIKTDIKGYKVVERESNYAGIKQRWLIVESSERKKSDLKKLSQKIEKDKERANTIVKNLSQKNYQNISELRAVFEWEEKKLKYHHLTLKDFASAVDNNNKKTVYKATSVLKIREDKIAEQEIQGVRSQVVVASDFLVGDCNHAPKKRSRSSEGFKPKARCLCSIITSHTMKRKIKGTSSDRSLISPTNKLLLRLPFEEIKNKGLQWIIKIKGSSNTDKLNRQQIN